MLAKVVDQHHRIGGLRKGFVFPGFCGDTHFPTVLVYIETNVQHLIPEIWFRTLRTHSKPHRLWIAVSCKCNLQHCGEVCYFFNIGSLRTLWCP